MKKYIILIISLIIVISLLITYSFTNKNDLNDLNELINFYYEIINPDKLDFNNNLYSFNGTLNEQYHYIDAHGGPGLSFNEEIKYIITPDINNNITYIKLDNINTKIDNKYINYYFKLLNMNNINLNNKEYKRYIFYLEYDITNDFNNMFNTNYNNVILKKYHDKYIILFDNSYINISKNEISYYKDNNVICTININDSKNNVKIIFNDRNNINIIKESNSDYRYNFLINNIPFYISKKNNKLNLKINYIARKYNDFTINTNYNINKIDNIDKNLINEDKLNDLAIYDYIEKIKEVIK